MLPIFLSVYKMKWDCCITGYLFIYLLYLNGQPSHKQVTLDGASKLKTICANKY